MESHLVDVTNELEVAEVVAAYWDLSSPDLLCAPGFTGPDLGAIKNGKYVPILCKEGGKTVGVMVVKAEDHGVFYPVLTGDYAAVLRSMILCAREEFGTLIATTENRLIHETALNMGLPDVVSEGDQIWWK